MAKEKASSLYTILRYVIPFRMDIKNVSDFDEYARRVDADGNWERKTALDFSTESDLYEYVRNEFLFDDNDGGLDGTKVGATWSAKKNSNGIIKKLVFSDLTANKAQVLEKMITIPITEMELLIFKNGLGMLWYEISLSQTRDLDEDFLVSFQYIIKELARNKPFLWEESIKPSEYGSLVKQNARVTKYYSPVLLGKYLEDRISFLNPIYMAKRKSPYKTLFKNTKSISQKAGLDFIEGNEYSSGEVDIPDKALLFSYVAMPRNYEDEFVFYITNGYKNSYKLGDEERQEMKRPFDNVTWYATKEGCSYIASYDSFGGSYSNKDFFIGTFPSKIRGDYFAMYLKVLYQTQSLLLYADRINHEIYSDVQKYLYFPIEAEITSLYAEVNLFISKSMATSVSHIHQQSEFFNYLKKQLKIHEDVKSITSGLEAIEGLQREQLKHEEESHEKERDNKMQAIMGAFTLLAIASAFEDTLSFWNDLHDINLTTPHIISFAIIGVISLGALLAIIVIFFNTFIKTSRFAKWCIRQKNRIKKFF